MESFLEYLNSNKYYIIFTIIIAVSITLTIILLNSNYNSKPESDSESKSECDYNICKEKNKYFGKCIKCPNNYIFDSSTCECTLNCNQNSSLELPSPVSDPENFQKRTTPIDDKGNPITPLQCTPACYEKDENNPLTCKLYSSNSDICIDSKYGFNKNTTTLEDCNNRYKCTKTPGLNNTLKLVDFLPKHDTDTVLTEFWKTTLPKLNIALLVSGVLPFLDSSPERFYGNGIISMDKKSGWVSNNNWNSSNDNPAYLSNLYMDYNEDKLDPKAVPYNVNSKKYLPPTFKYITACNDEICSKMSNTSEGELYPMSYNYNTSPAMKPSQNALENYIYNDENKDQILVNLIYVATSTKIKNPHYTMKLAKSDKYIYYKNINNEVTLHALDTTTANANTDKYNLAHFAFALHSEIPGTQVTQNSIIPQLSLRLISNEANFDAMVCTKYKDIPIYGPDCKSNKGGWAVNLHYYIDEDQNRGRILDSASSPINYFSTQSKTVPSTLCPPKEYIKDQYMKPFNSMAENWDQSWCQGTLRHVANGQISLDSSRKWKSGAEETWYAKYNNLLNRVKDDTYNINSICIE